jgi:hypothetical protein
METLIPPDVIRGAKDRQKRKRYTWSWREGPDVPLIHNLNFSDISKIIQKNWGRAFIDVFRDRSICQKLKELEPIRKAVMHPSAS